MFPTKRKAFLTWYVAEAAVFDLGEDGDILRRRMCCIPQCFHPSEQRGPFLWTSDSTKGLPAEISKTVFVTKAYSHHTLSRLQTAVSLLSSVMHPHPDLLVHYAHNGGEVGFHSIDGCRYMVDGYDSTTHIVYAFLGVLLAWISLLLQVRSTWKTRHLGNSTIIPCIDCITATSWHQPSGDPVGMWLHAYMPEALDQRDAFFGGRTNVKQDEIIQYIDVFSPYIIFTLSLSLHLQAWYLPRRTSQRSSSSVSAVWASWPDLMPGIATHSPLPFCSALPRPWKFYSLCVALVLENNWIIPASTVKKTEPWSRVQQLKIVAIRCFASIRL